MCKGHRIQTLDSLASQRQCSTQAPASALSSSSSKASCQSAALASGAAAIASTYCIVTEGSYEVCEGDKAEGQHGSTASSNRGVEVAKQVCCVGRGVCQPAAAALAQHHIKHSPYKHLQYDLSRSPPGFQPLPRHHQQQQRQPAASATAAWPASTYADHPCLASHAACTVPAADALQM